MRQLPSLKVKRTHSFTCGERKIWSDIEMSQNIKKLIVWKKIFFPFYVFIDSESGPKDSYLG